MRITQFQPHLWPDLLTTLAQAIELIASVISKQLRNCRRGDAHTPSDMNRFDLPSRDQPPHGPL